MVMKMWRKENLGAQLVGMFIGTDSMKNIMEASQKMKIKNRITI